MLNIHFKIEARKTAEVNIPMLKRISQKSYAETLNGLYNRFENSDYFMLPYRVQKLSKKARRKTN